MSQLGSFKRIFTEDVTDDMMQKAFEVAQKAFAELKPGMSVNASVSETIRDEFNRIYGKSWNCVVGKNFGAFVTHCTRTYMYFSVVPGVSVLLWRARIDPSSESKEA